MKNLGHRTPCHFARGTRYGNAACRRWFSCEHAPQDPPGEMLGKRASYGTFAAVGCVREHGRKSESNPTAAFFEKEGLEAQ